MSNKKEEYRRYLPHIQPDDAIFFITFRLKDTLPKDILFNYLHEKEELIRTNHTDNIPTLYLEKIDKYLDHAKDYFLKEDKIAKVIQDSIFFYEGKYYEVIAFCIMPNHIHLLLNTNHFPYIPLYKILGRIKGFSAKNINKIRETKGHLWSNESYDHLIKTKNELANVIEYIIHNPVKAELVSNWKKWEHTYVKENYLEE